MIDLGLLILMALAAYRIWRLVGLDDLTEPLRDRFTPDGRMALFVVCPWCAGFWISLAVVIATDQLVSLPLPALQVAAVSCLVGLVGGNLDG